ncbi:hypothetical protein [Roseomonas genomospecies 6]|uniref:hypothetical protein n=1 Tax=Roseomonas genomospecies 6 TaxID=214106 RepID=UPI0011F3E1B5|nr:hypothetical protein [Roseomonas genomospecies 6]
MGSRNRRGSPLTADAGFGPFLRNLDPAERAARSRTLAALVRVFAGSAAGPLVAALHCLERDAQAADEALALFDALPARPRRHALGAYAAPHADRHAAR